MPCIEKEKRQPGVKRKRRILYVFILSFLIFSLFMGKTIMDIRANPLTEEKKASSKSYEINKQEPQGMDGEEAILPGLEEGGKLPSEDKEGGIETPTGNSQVKDAEDTAVKIKDVFCSDGKKTAYLTFDDGPSKNITPKILDILKKYEIKATFFVIGSLAEKNPEILRRAAKEGHAIGNHSYSHNYKKLYSSVDNFIEEVDKSSNLISEILGESYKTTIFRFPGGSWGKKYTPFKEALKSMGYEYVDWNAVTGDAEGHNIPKDKLLNRLAKTLKGQEDVIILMHDAAAKKTTVEALPEVIEYLKSLGYSFKTLK